jgi:hypothetical protein
VRQSASVSTERGDVHVQRLLGDVSPVVRAHDPLAFGRVQTLLGRAAKTRLKPVCQACDVADGKQFYSRERKLLVGGDIAQNGSAAVAESLQHGNRLTFVARRQNKYAGMRVQLRQLLGALVAEHDHPGDLARA